MQYRAYAYFTPTGIVDDGVVLTGPATIKDKANETLEKLLTLPGFTGGGLEIYVPNFGWVMGDEDDAETIQIIARRQEQD